MTPEPAPKVMNRTPMQPVWSAGEMLDPLYADQLHVTRVGDAFYLTFGQVTVPLGPQPEAGGVAEIKQVARLVLSKAAFQQIAELFQRVREDEIGG